MDDVALGQWADDGGALMREQAADEGPSTEELGRYGADGNPHCD